METIINRTVTGITENYSDALGSISNTINKNNYVLKIDGVETSTSELNEIVINLTNLTYTGKKKVAKRILRYNKLKSKRSINTLFYVLKKMGVIDEKIYVSMSYKEAEIQTARRDYVRLRNETEAARILYKTIKGDFYK